jgi:hypothetical protein
MVFNVPDTPNIFIKLLGISANEKVPHFIYILILSSKAYYVILFL